MKTNSFIKRFLLPVVGGWLFAKIALFLGGVTWFEGIPALQTFFTEGYLVRGAYTISKNFMSFLLFFAPFLTLVLVASGIKNIRGDVKQFLKRFTIILVTTLVGLAAVTVIISLFVVPFMVTNEQMAFTKWPEPFFVFDLKAPIDVFAAIVIGVIVGASIQEDSVYDKLIIESEKIVLNVVRHVIIPLSPLWIFGSFAASVYSSDNAQVIIVDLLLSALILAIQFGWLLFMYVITSKYAKVALKSIIKAATKIYLVVLSLAGQGTGIIVPIIVEEEEKLGYNVDKAKFISASSFNMPGSLISHIVFMYGTAMMFNHTVSFAQIALYCAALIFVLIISPAISGGVFALTSSLLSPMLGFSEEMINLMSVFYFKQGTSNAAVNNCADFYLTGLSLSKKDIEQIPERAASAEKVFATIEKA